MRYLTIDTIDTAMRGRYYSSVVKINSLEHLEGSCPQCSSLQVGNVALSLFNLWKEMLMCLGGKGARRSFDGRLAQLVRQLIHLFVLLQRNVGFLLLLCFLDDILFRLLRFFLLFLLHLLLVVFF